MVDLLKNIWIYSSTEELNRKRKAPCEVLLDVNGGEHAIHLK
jgi:hypothetical protein